MKKKLTNEVLRLHNWRKEFNDDDIGYGYDQYKPEEKFHYPEAYAIFGSGYLKLYKVTKKKEYLQCAHKCYDWLLNNSSPRYKNLSWGLPWEWKKWNASRDLSYLITTAFVADFLIDFHQIAKKETTKQIRSIISWITEENGYLEDEDGILFYYANHEPLKFLIYNPSAYTIGVLSKARSLDLDKNVYNYIKKALKLLLSHQNKDGSWNYSERSKKIDNFHTALILEGLVKAHECFKSNAIKRMLDNGLEFYKKEFFSSTGTSREKIIQPPDGKIGLKKIKRYANYYFDKISYRPNARLWSYGGALRLFSLTSDKRLAKKVATYALRKLQKGDGSFKFKKNHDGKFIRHEAHIFAGMASYLIM